MIKIAISICVLAGLVIPLGACATSKAVYGPDGSKQHSITCGWGTQNACYEKAGELCGTQGYKVVERRGGMYRTVVVKCGQE